MKFRFALKPLLAATLTVFSLTAFSQQVEYIPTRTSDGVDLTFRWLDYSGAEQGVILSVPHADLQYSLNDPMMRIKPDRIGHWLFEKAKLEADSMSYGGYHLSVEEDLEGNILVYGEGDNKQELSSRVDKVKSSHLLAANNLEQHSYFMIADNTFQFDYARIIRDSQASVAGLAETLINPSQDIRSNINRLLPFVQSIPYDALDRPDDYGFYTPLRMLIMNAGDCESKQMTLAAMIRSVAPRTDIILMGLHDHMVIGIHIDPLPGDQTYLYDGKVYVLMDATGPKMAPVGKLSIREIKRLKTMQPVIYPV